ESCGPRGECAGGVLESHAANRNGGYDQFFTKSSRKSRSDGSNVFTEEKYKNGDRIAYRQQTLTRDNRLVPGVAPKGENKYWRDLKDLFKGFVFDPADLKACWDISIECGWIVTDIPLAGTPGKIAKIAKIGHDAEKAEKLAKKMAQAGECLTEGAKHSFLAGTDVELADGGIKDIEDVDVGDQVLATDPETGKTSPRKVVGTIVTHDDKKFTELTVLADSKNSKLTATDTHPFWSLSDKAWVDAGDLRPGDRLRSSDDTVVTITATRHYTKHQRTYDLTIDRDHTYYVLAGETPVLVHNSGGCPDLDALSQSGMRPAKGKTTHAGREYQKHMNRRDLPVVPGKELKTAGQDLLDDILTNPQTATSAVNSGNFAGGTRYIMPDPAGGRGIGATFDANGQFQYFGRY
ncbi:Hint domain-containing protein, partial [Streptomyces sp. NRRL F-5630]|uniref:Hint domain-containing protein n=1 Tax=Streptomyces sp. NRRL F-5630 TaxID=1463864 RepID=UPI003EB8725D